MTPAKTPTKAQGLKRLGSGLKPRLRSKRFFLGRGHAERPCPGFSCHLPFQVKALARSRGYSLDSGQAGIPGLALDQASVKGSCGVQSLCLSPKCTGE